MAAALRGSTPSLTPLPTPNTAPVHEFRCLFTHDSHKKAKKWHDGTVRFHTFNRRVMVYDDGKNYVGDLHYRQDEDFDEGVELRLDRGILVDVGERLGETQTDLAPILDRKKDEPSPQAARTVRRVAAASQKDPKSLSQILGTQPRTGRARLLPSAYQQRQPLTQVQPSETLMPPPPKRQKVGLSGKENSPSSLPQTKKPAQTVRQRAQIMQPDPRTVAPKNTVVDSQEVVDLSSDEEVSKAARKTLPKLSKRKMRSQAKGQTTQMAPTKEVRSVTDAISPTTQEQRRENKTDLAQKPANSTRKLAEKAKTRTEESSSRTKTSQRSASCRPGMTQLIFRNRKPRRKLMYRALLPSTKAESAPLSDDQSQEYRSSDAILPRDADEAIFSPRSIAHHESLGPAVRSPSRRGSVGEPVQVLSSPLFIPEENAGESPISSPKGSQDSLAAQMFKQPSTPKSEVAIRKQSGEPSTRMSPTNQENGKMSHTTCLYPSKQTQVLPPPVLEPTSLHKTTSPSSRQRPFRRVRSENDIAEEEILEFDAFSAPPPSFLAHSKASPVRAFTNFSRSPAKLRRTASESAIIEQEKETVTSYNIEPIEEAIEESGPWTSAEAYLLFEWWPPGKPKPDHGVPALKAGHVEPQRFAITTARDMLRDEINVL